MCAMLFCTVVCDHWQKMVLFRELLPKTAFILYKNLSVFLGVFVILSTRKQYYLGRGNILSVDRIIQYKLQTLGFCVKFKDAVSCMLFLNIFLIRESSVDMQVTLPSNRLPFPSMGKRFFSVPLRPDQTNNNEYEEMQVKHNKNFIMVLWVRLMTTYFGLSSKLGHHQVKT